MYYYRQDLVHRKNAIVTVDCASCQTDVCHQDKSYIIVKLHYCNEF